MSRFSCFLRVLEQEGKHMKSLLSTLGLAVAGLVLAGTGTINAAGFRSQNIAIPFEFKVEKITLPAGTYRLEQKTGTPFVFLMNTQTGRGVQVMRETINDPTVNTVLSFRNNGEGYTLHRVF
jgi:hypothetical protein